MKIRFTFFAFLFVFCLQAQNLIKNSSFDDGIKDWEFKIANHFEGKENLKAKFDPYEKPNASKHKTAARIRVISADKDEKYQTIAICQKILGLKKAKRYRFTAWVRSNISREDAILVQLFSGKATGSKLPYAQFYSNKQTFIGDGEWQKVSFDFDMTTNVGGKGDIKNVGLRIGFAGRMGTFYIDSISLTRI